MIRYQPKYRVGTIRYEGETNVGVRGPAGPGLEFIWDGTRLGVREAGQSAYQYVDLLGPEGKTGPEGKQGKQGERGEAFTYDDFTPEQLLALVGPEGKSLEFTWNGTSLGVRVQGQAEYQYVDLEGKEGKQGPVGPQGKTGPIGPAFTYEDFTPEQLLALVGAPGVGIQDIQRTKGNGAQGTMDTYTVTLTDGRTYDFFVYNGKDGDGAGDMTAAVYDPEGKKQDIFHYVDEKVRNIDVDVTADEVTFADGETYQQKYDEGELTGPEGPQGPAGANGAPGYTPQKGVDYWTTADRQSMVQDVLSALPVYQGEVASV